MSEKILLYSAQSQEVVNKLKKDGCTYVYKEHIQRKYLTSADSFLIAYHWFSKAMLLKVNMPSGAEFPVWHYSDPQYMVLDLETRPLKLLVPWDQVLLFDNQRWERILNLDYIPKDEEDKMKFESVLEQNGLDAGFRVFQNAYYPHLKSKIISSWSRVFELNDSSIVRGATWKLDMSWIVE